MEANMLELATELESVVAIRRCRAQDSPHASVVTEDGGRRSLKLDLRISQMFGDL
jgi:hypothetical protein